jgi:hypothetical protein
MNDLAATAPSAPPGLRIAPSPGRGRGVFATRAFAPGEVIERAAVIVFPRAAVAALRGTVLDDYWFFWDPDHNAAALGCGALYNHGCPANARFDRDLDAMVMVFRAVRPIAAGTEVTINYNGESDDPDPVWFEAR